MKKEEIVNQVMSAIEKKNWEYVESNLTDDFTFSGAVPKPLDKRQWLNVQRAIQAGIPDLKFNMKQISLKDDDKVTAKVKLSGNHTAELPPVLQGRTAIPPTGKKVTLPEEELEFTIKGDKISNVNVKPVANGGVLGLLQQLDGAFAGSSSAKM